VSGDMSDEMRRRRAERERQEYQQYNSEHAKAQRAIDWAWELELARRAERAWRRPDEIPERGRVRPDRALRARDRPPVNDEEPRLIDLRLQHCLHVPRLDADHR
jgi:hypothetical protein